MENKENQFDSTNFVTLLTKAQLELKIFITALLGDISNVEEVLQETNLDLWKKAQTYDPHRPFLPWAKAIAKYQVMKFRTKCKRERLVFDDELISLFPIEDSGITGDEDIHLQALMNCLKKLTTAQRKYLYLKYVEQKSILEMVSFLGHSFSSIVSMLYRLRKSLYKCVEQTLETGSLE